MDTWIVSEMGLQDSVTQSKIVDKNSLNHCTLIISNKSRIYLDQYPEDLSVIPQYQMMAKILSQSCDADLIILCTLHR